MRLARHPHRRERVYLRGILRYGRTHRMREARKSAAGSRVRLCHTEEQEAFLQLLEWQERLAFSVDPGAITFTGVAAMLRR